MRREREREREGEKERRREWKRPDKEREKAKVVGAGNGAETETERVHWISVFVLSWLVLEHHHMRAKWHSQEELLRAAHNAQRTTHHTAGRGVNSTTRNSLDGPLTRSSLSSLVHHTAEQHADAQTRSAQHSDCLSLSARHLSRLEFYFGFCV